MLPRVENDTDFLAEPHLLCDRDGEHVCVIVKATFEHVPGPPRRPDGTFVVAPRARRRPIRPIDFPWGEPDVPSIRYPSDLCVRKPGTDVIVVARGFSPKGEPVPRFDCGVRVGKVSKTVRVTGPRVWAQNGDSITEPRPTTGIELRYDYAFGGRDDSNPEKIVEEPRNPVGMGVASNPASLDAAPAPQIEDPRDPVRSASSRPRPAGLGAIGRSFEPRRSRWGTYDAEWLESRSPLPPDDFDERANFAATPELVAVPPLAGGEEGALTGLTPGGGTLSFVLPAVRLSITFEVPGAAREAVAPHLDTLLLDGLGPIEHRRMSERDPEFPPPPDGDLVVEMVWRASILAPRRLGDVRVRVREERGR